MSDVTQLVVIVVLGSTVWVAVDARGRDWSRSSISGTPGGWALGTLLLWIVFFPLYLAARATAPRGAMFAVASPPYAGPSALTDWKSCPDCAETVRAAARRCRYCHYRFEEAV